MSYATLENCMDALQRLHPADIGETHDRLYEMLNGLSSSATPPVEHLECLEQCREQVHRVQHEMAREYALYPLSPDSSSNTTLLRVVALWRTMSLSYAQITRNDAPQGLLDDQKALLAQRRVYYAGLVVLEFFRARRSVPEQVWAELNKSMAMAEAQGIANVRVVDTMNKIWHAQSAMQAYIAILLIDLANPAGRTAQQFNLICRWAQRFAPYCDLRPEHGETTPAKPNTYGLSLNLNHGLRPLSTLPTNGNLRRFDGSKLAGQIRAVIEQLKSGEKPVSLGLGTGASPEVCARLLLSLYRPWGLGSSARKFSRRSCQGYAELATDWLAIGYHISGQPFHQPETPIKAMPQANNKLSASFRERALAPLDAEALLQRQLQADLNGYSSEHWLLQDQSVGGFRLQLHSVEPVLNHHQLVAVRPPDSLNYLLGQVSWMHFHDDGTLETGVQVLNGLPQVIAARPLEGPPMFQQAFWLPEIPALKQPATVVLPAGWYPHHRIIQVCVNDKLHTLRLNKRLVAGHDFDQLCYEEISARHA